MQKLQIFENKALLWKYPVTLFNEKLQTRPAVPTCHHRALLKPFLSQHHHHHRTTHPHKTKIRRVYERRNTLLLLLLLILFLSLQPSAYVYRGYIRFCRIPRPVSLSLSLSLSLSSSLPLPSPARQNVPGRSEGDGGRRREGEASSLFEEGISQSNALDARRTVPPVFSSISLRAPKTNFDYFMQRERERERERGGGRPRNGDEMYNESLISRSVFSRDFRGGVGVWRCAKRAHEVVLFELVMVYSLQMRDTTHVADAR